MLPVRFISLHVRFRLLATLLLAFLFLGGCASQRLNYVPEPPEITNWSGTYKTDSFTNADGLNIFGRYWLPEGKPRAAVVVLHGTALHSGVYEDLGEYLATKGYVVYAMDMQGWGQSDSIGKRGDVFNHDKYVSDVGVIIERMHSDYPDIPVFGFGESLGGMVCLLGQVERRSFFDGLILSSPAYKPNLRFPLGVHLPDIMYQWIWSLGNFAGPISPQWLQTMPAIPPNPGLRLIVKDQAVRQSLLDDPYVTHTWLPLRYLGGVAQSATYLRKRIEMITVPIYILQAGEDELVPVSSSEEIVRRAMSRDRQIKVFPGASHAVFIQKERYEAIIDVGKWLDDRTAPRLPSAMELDPVSAVPAPR